MSEHPLDILGPDLATGSISPQIDASALGGTLPNEISTAGLTGPGGGQSISTLNIDTNDFAAPAPSTAVKTDIDLASPRVRTENKATQAKLDAKNERAAAAGGVAGAAIEAGISIWANVETLKAEDKIFMDKIQRGFETMEYNTRMVRNASNMTALNNSLNAIDQLTKQGGNVLAGGQEQLFLRSPNTGRIV